MLKDLAMQVAMYACMGLLVLICVFILAYWRIALNIKVIAKRITEGKVSKVGDIYRNGTILNVRFLWTRRKVSSDKIISIVGYSDDYMEMEEPSTESVEIGFKGGVSIVFNTAEEEHLKIIEDFARATNVTELPESWSRWAYGGEEDKPVVFYKKKKRNKEK